MRILLLGQDPELGRALGICLHAKGHQMDFLPGARRMPEIVRQQYDVIVVDLSQERTGEDTGAAVIHELRREGQAPVIALSDRWKGRSDEAVSTGANACLEKPFGLNQLLACMEALRAAAYDAAGIPTAWS